MINLSMAEPDNLLRPRISVVGVGGAGGNAINNMIRSNLEGCDFIAANTDAQALSLSLASRKLQLGVTLSRGLGAGSKPEIGRAAAEEQLVDIMSLLEGSDMLFVTAGMGGGTGTGAAPVIARAARESGILTVGVVTKPFNFEGSQRMRQAEAGIAELQQYVDTLIVIPNQNLFRVANERTTFAEAFRMADEVLHSGVRGITDLMVMPGFMNLDFADVKTVMSEMGKAMMGTGEAEGDNRALCAAEAAIANPLLDDISMKGARGVLINITGGLDMTLFEMDQAANRIREEVDPDAQIKVGSTLGENLEGRIRVSIIATGIDAALAEQQRQRAGESTRKPAQQAPQTQPRLTTTEQTARRAAAPAPMAQPAPVKQASPVTTASVNVSSSYFTMPTTLTPQMVAPTRTAAPIPQAAAQNRQDAEDDFGDMSMESDEQDEPVSARAEARSLPTLSSYTRTDTRNEPPRATMSPTSSAPPSPMRTLHPAASPAALRAKDVRDDDIPDMRMTQLTTASNQAQTASSHVNQRSQSLFKRITGFGMIRPSAAREEEEAELAEAQAVQARLDIDPTDRPVLSSSESSDILDIPAFLRRQTNH